MPTTAISLGTLVSGKLYLSAIPCPSGNATACTSGQRQTYVGNFNSHASPLLASTTLSISVSATNSTTTSTTLTTTSSTTSTTTSTILYCTSGYYYENNECNPYDCQHLGTYCLTEYSCSSGSTIGCATTGTNSCSPTGCTPG